jgi:hypothetical protein
LIFPTARKPKAIDPRRIAPTIENATSELIGARSGPPATEKAA